MTICNTAPLDSPCTKCGRDETCAQFNDQRLCQDCWHAAREGETPYAVIREADGYCACGGAYLKEEAEEFARKLTAEDQVRVDSFVRYRNEATTEESRAHWQGNIDHANRPGAAAWRIYTAKPCKSWWGHRTAHPAYMDRRRAALGGRLR